MKIPGAWSCCALPTSKPIQAFHQMQTYLDRASCRSSMRSASCFIAVVTRRFVTFLPTFGRLDRLNRSFRSKTQTHRLSKTKRIHWDLEPLLRKFQNTSQSICNQTYIVSRKQCSGEFLIQCFKFISPLPPMPKPPNAEVVPSRSKHQNRRLIGERPGFVVANPVRLTIQPL